MPIKRAVLKTLTPTQTRTRTRTRGRSRSKHFFPFPLSKPISVVFLLCYIVVGRLSRLLGQIGSQTCCNAIATREGLLFSAHAHLQSRLAGLFFPFISWCSASIACSLAWFPFRFLWPPAFDAATSEFADQIDWQSGKSQPSLWKASEAKRRVWRQTWLR